MKSIILSSLFVTQFVCFTIKSQSNVILLNLGSHNEMTDPAHGVNYNNNTNFTTIKNLLYQIADSVNVNNAKWNMQVESNFILGCLQFDNAYLSEFDVIETLNDMPKIEVDPHNHLDTIVFQNPNFNPYNYADLNHLLDSCGLTTRTNVGGFIYTADDWVNADWTKWRYGLQGRTFPNQTWTPQVLWGGGTLNHQQDVDPLGIWHPGGATVSTFLTNDPSQLLDIGNGCKWLIKDTTNVDVLLNEINNYITTINALSPTTNTFYASTIMFDFRSLLNAGYTDKIFQVLRGIKPFVDNGTVVWQTLTEKKNDWLSTHNNTTDNFIKVCNDVVLGVNETEINSIFEVYPNPTHSNLIVNVFSNDIFSFEIYNYQGNKLKQFTTNKQQTFSIDVSDLANGIYFIKNSSSNEILKFVKE